MSLRNATHWFNEASRRGYRGPVLAAIVLDDGSLVHIDYRNRADRQKAADTFGRYVGHVTFIPASEKWVGEGQHPVNPQWSVYAPHGFATAEEAAAALLAKMAEVKAEEEAVRANPEAHLERELKAYDWWAHMSDSPGVCDASDAHWRNVIEPLRAKVAPEVWERLLAEHSPKGE